MLKKTFSPFYFNHFQEVRWADSASVWVILSQTFFKIQRGNQKQSASDTAPFYRWRNFRIERAKCVWFSDWFNKIKCDNKYFEHINNFFRSTCFLFCGSSIKLFVVKTIYIINNVFFIGLLVRIFNKYKCNL